MHALEVSKTWIWDQAPVPSFAGLLTRSSLDLCFQEPCSSDCGIPPARYADCSVQRSVACVPPCESRAYESLGET
jgi:hypothetical protein